MTCHQHSTDLHHGQVGRIRTWRPVLGWQLCDHVTCPTMLDHRRIKLVVWAAQGQLHNSMWLTVQHIINMKGYKNPLAASFKQPNTCRTRHLQHSRFSLLEEPESRYRYTVIGRIFVTMLGGGHSLQPFQNKVPPKHVTKCPCFYSAIASS